ncbi:MAG: transporter substrate-binding domain-containing protein, partial [Gammaproteobacteria bacterium]
MNINHQRWYIVLTVIGLLAALTAFYSLPRHTEVMPLRIGVYDNSPKVYRDEQQRPAGMFIDLLQAMARVEGWQLQFVDCHWHDCLERLETGKIDLMPDVALTQERDRRFDFHTIPVTHSWSGIWGRPDLVLLGLEDLGDLRIAVLQGSVQEKALDNMMRGYDLSYTPVLTESLARGFEAVLEGKAEAVVANSHFANRHNIHYELRETPIVFNPASLYYATGKGRHADVLLRIDINLARWRQDAESVYYQVLKQAMVPPQKPAIPTLLWWVLGLSAAALIISLSISGLLRWQVARRTEQLTRINTRLDHLLQASPVILYQLSVNDNGFEACWISENINRLFGYKAEQIFDVDWWLKTVHPDDREDARAGIAMVKEQQHITQEYRIFDAHGQVRYIRDEMQYLPAAAGEDGEIVGSWSDLTQTRKQEGQLRFLTNYDPLTHLPNRAFLRSHLNESLQRARSFHSPLALLSIDLDRFKTINESFGYSTGDKMFQTISERLKQVLRL